MCGMQMQEGMEIRRRFTLFFPVLGANPVFFSSNVMKPGQAARVVRDLALHAQGMRSR